MPAGSVGLYGHADISLDEAITVDGELVPFMALSSYEDASTVNAVGEPAKDFWIAYAEREIWNTYGDRVSVWQKAKSLNKFGRTLNADNGVKTTIATFQGAVVNETFAAGNTVDSVVSSSGSDTGAITIEGHTIDTINGDKKFVVQDATLAGQTPVTLATPLHRCTRMYVKKGTYAAAASDLVGNVACYDSAVATGVTSGVPDVATATKCMIPAGGNQSDKCATALSSVDYWIITHVEAGLEKGSGATAAADVDIEYREKGGVWRPLGLQIDLSEASGPWASRDVVPHRIIPPNSDIKAVATSNANDTQVDMTIDGVLAIKV